MSIRLRCGVRAGASGAARVMSSVVEAPICMTEMVAAKLTRSPRMTPAAGTEMAGMTLHPALVEEAAADRAARSAATVEPSTPRSPTTGSWDD